MKQIFLFLSVVFFFALNTQAQELQFNQKDIGDTKTIVCTNSSNKDFEVIFTYTSKGYNVSAASPVKQIVKANSVKDIASFTKIKGQATSIQMNYNYKEIRTLGTTKNLSHNFDGITVFGKNRCGRCDFFTNGLKKNNVSFKEMNIDTNSDDNSLMWAKLQEAGFSGTSITTPVVVVDNKVYYNIKDLSALLAQLKAKY